nr:LysE family transporter [Rhodoluna sp.]
MEAYWLFATIWFVAAATPGADTMLLLTTSLSTGWKSAIPISLGIIAAKVILLTLTYFGFAALI